MCTVCMYVWRVEVNVRCLLSLPSSFLSASHSISDSDRLSGSELQGFPISVPLVLGLHIWATAAGLYMDARDPNSDPSLCLRVKNYSLSLSRPKIHFKCISEQECGSFDKY